eukprot:CAMPEP_0184863036 /NCGR_PEP_ID=MMETSP0580-20130426/8630_1 /TAXON_ID=1118495 /ORGANISM="Dactyliosolen fragilissimus" /LENGTH=538 /DNA_ID=CAMNT_0027361089 /DNA_START=326 /DNA_END=1942 /DNA_ORIENTATION=+
MLLGVKKRKGDLAQNNNKARIRMEAQTAASAVRIAIDADAIHRNNAVKPKNGRTTKNGEVNKSIGTKGRNVYAAFTSKAELNDLDIIESYQISSQGFEPTIMENKESDGNLNDKIKQLLSDDDGEEDDELPDYSEEAANQLADKRTYSKISDEAKFKANIAVRKKTKISIIPSSDISGNLRRMPGGSNASNGKKGREPKVHANVQETGSDTMSNYAKTMGQHALLPKDSEILLGRHIQILVRWEEKRNKLEEELERPPTFAQWATSLEISVPQLKKQIRKSQRAKAALMEANLRLVVTVARQTVKKSRSEISFQDACQEGILGLKKACEKFDPEKGFRFSTYAVWWIKREVHKSVTEQSRTMRLPAHAMKKINDMRINERLLMNELGRKPTDEEIAKKIGLTVEKLHFYRKAALDATSLDKEIISKVGKGSNASGGNSSNGKTVESFVQDTGPTPAELANRQMLKDDVKSLIKTLSPREQAVIRLRFGLDDGTPRTLEYIGNKFSANKELIRKIEAKALLKLRQPYRNHSVQCYVKDL